jgi:hypothetical protein
VESPDILLVWGDGASADCLTCHTGAQTTVYVDADGQTRTASAKSVYFSAGHGAGSFGQECSSCHSLDFDSCAHGRGRHDAFARPLRQGFQH